MLFFNEETRQIAVKPVEETIPFSFDLDEQLGAIVLKEKKAE